MIKKLCMRLHLWLSVPLGLLITLMCLSGAILIFERDFADAPLPRVNPASGAVPLPLDSILRAADRHIAGEHIIVGVTTYPDPSLPYKVALDGHASGALWVDQYTGRVIERSQRAAIFKIARSAHRRLFGRSKAEGGGGGKVGKLVIGITSISLLLIIITGLIAWWPRRGMWRQRLTIVASKGGYRFWLDFHRVCGALSAGVLLLCVLTGLCWSFGWYKTAFYAALGAEAPKSSLRHAPAENFAAWQAAYAQIRQQCPDKEIRMYQGDAEVLLGGTGNQQASATYTYSPADGHVLTVTPYSEKSKPTRIKGWILTLHIGAWLGWASKILYLVSVLIGAMLPLTGYYLWIKRLMAKRSHRVSTR